MKKNNKEAEEPTSGPGWAAYQEVPEDFDGDAWHRSNAQGFEKISYINRFRWKAMEQLTQFWFKVLVKQFARSVYDIGPGDFGVFTETQRYQPRAVYLLKNRWTTIQFGIYLIEYTIVEDIAYSYYSLNYGIRYINYMETKLTKNQEMNLKIIIDLFRETEEYLHQTFADRKPPYTPNYLFR